MEIWAPDENDPYDQAWWRPLERVAFVVARDRSLPRLGIDEFGRFRPYADDGSDIAGQPVARHLTLVV